MPKHFDIFRKYKNYVILKLALWYIKCIYGIKKWSLHSWWQRWKTNRHSTKRTVSRFWKRGSNKNFPKFSRFSSSTAWKMRKFSSLIGCRFFGWNSRIFWFFLELLKCGTSKIQWVYLSFLIVSFGLRAEQIVSQKILFLLLFQIISVLIHDKYFVYVTQ